MKRIPPGTRLKWLKEHVNHEGDDCLPWPYSKHESGYGQATYMGKKITANRLMCMLAHGNPPTSEHQASHSCGKGHEGCVNPKHLRWATPLENSREKKIHGTQCSGPDCWNYKLTDSDVLEIRQVLAQEESSPTELAEKYGVHRSHIYNIRNGYKRTNI